MRKLGRIQKRIEQHLIDSIRTSMGNRDVLEQASTVVNCYQSGRLSPPDNVVPVGN